MDKSVRITVDVTPPPTIEERSKNAAKRGDVEALYELIKEKADFLTCIDRKDEFVDTPFHIAAAAGRTEFTMELMGLKPSLARKLNQDGLSPMHLALKYGYTETALSLLASDNKLASIRGKNGYTPFHFGVLNGSPEVLVQFLTDCPNCIHDVTNRNETAFHLAARKNDYEAFEILLPWLWSSDCSMRQIKRILNMKNRDGDTMLHLAASNNQKKILKLLTQYGVINMKATNSKNLTALCILERRNQKEDKECARVLRCAQHFNSVCFIPLFFVEQISQLAHRVKNMSSDCSNTLLVVTVLILTAAYQATLSPPGGVFQADAAKGKEIQSSLTSNTRNSDELFTKSPSAAGSSVLNTADFLWFFIPNVAAFFLSFLITCFILIAILPGVFSSTLVASLTLLLFCLLISSVLIISPNPTCLDIMFHYVYILFYLVFFVVFFVIIVVLVKKLRKKIFTKHFEKQAT